MMAVLELRSLESGGIIGSGMTDTRWKSLRDAYGYCNGQQDLCGNQGILIHKDL